MARVHHQLAVNCFHCQVARFELGPNINSDAEYLQETMQKYTFNVNGECRR